MYTVVPLLSFIAYLSLFYIAMRHRPLRMVHKTFVMYLAGVVVWAGLTFVLYGDFFPGLTVTLSRFLLISGLYVTVAYYHFLRAFVDKPGGIGLILGYVMLAAAVPLIITGRVTYQINAGAEATPEVAFTLVGVAAMGVLTAALVGTAVVGLVQQYRRSTDPLFRNRVIYLLAGCFLMLAFGVTKMFPTVTQYPLSHVGNLANAVFMTLAIVQFNLLDIRIVARRGLVYAATGVCVLVLYFGLLFGLLRSLELQASYLTLIASAGVALTIAAVFYPIRKRIQGWTEHLFFGETYEYRNMLLAFAERMSNVLDINEVAENMLSLITRAIHVDDGGLYLADTGTGDFTSVHGVPAQAGRALSIGLTKDSPIVEYLAKEGRPLRSEQMDIVPSLRGLWQTERDELRQSGIEILFPIKNRQALIGILALGKKQHGAPYRTEDLDLVTTMLGGAGGVIENAQLYAVASARASIDELTGLFNHRCFHERLNEEIARGSRFGETFSVVMLDLDFFKTFNDLQGHLAGDEILKQLGSEIRHLIRVSDIGFRYGGDEFAVILPRTPLDGAQNTAARLRNGIEDLLGPKEIALTCSIGVGSWPRDGVMREDLIRATDAALYHAKQTGRNRVCLAAEVTANEILRAQPSERATSVVLDTIYALAATVDAKDHYTYGHSRKVTKYAIDIAEALGYPADRIATIRAAALLHDIGKIGVSDAVLQKVGPLDDDDWKVISSHPDAGVAILSRVDSLKDCLAAVRYHHERYDGGGYPTHLKGEDIPLDARILAVADAYDAMTSDRPYRSDKLSSRRALAELERCAGTQFDPKIVEVFVQIMRDARLRETGAAQLRTRDGSTLKHPDLTARPN